MFVLFIIVYKMRHFFNSTQIPQLLADILYESVNIRNNLIETVGAMEQLSKGIATFVKIAKNEKLKDKPLDKFIRFIETPVERLKALLDKPHEIDSEKYSNLKDCLVAFMNISGTNAIPDWVEQQNKCKKKTRRT
jgi:hypothetical protein